MARRKIENGYATKPAPRKPPRRRTARRAPDWAKTDKGRRQYESDVLDEAKQRRARRNRVKRIKGLKVL